MDNKEALQLVEALKIKVNARIDTLADQLLEHHKDYAWVNKHNQFLNSSFLEGTIKSVENEIQFLKNLLG